jgi:hypothetical protein
MTRGMSKLWMRSHASVLAAGTVLLFFLPTDACAHCESGQTFSDRFTELQVTRGSANAEAPNWALRLFHALNSVWTRPAVSTVPTKLTPCGSCPSDRTLPTNQCTGPSCSGGLPPIAVPVSTSVDKSHEPASLIGASQSSRYDSRSQWAGAAFSFLPSSCLDSIFHPPRCV